MLGCVGIYLLVVRYGSEAERKRLEYLVGKWRDVLRFERPGGAVLIVDGRVEDVMRFLEELYSRIPRERVSVYQLKEPEFHLEPLMLEGVVRTRMRVEEAWGAVNLVLARLRGALVSESGGERIYTVSSRKGVCRVRVSIVPSDDGSRLRFVVEGYSEAATYVYEKLLHELSYVGEVEKHA